MKGSTMLLKAPCLKVLCIVLAVSVKVMGGAGSGISVKVGAAKGWFTTTDKNYKIMIPNPYGLFPIEAVSPVVVPFSLSYSHSLHRIISVSAGLGFVSMGSEFKADNMSTDINTRWEIDDRRIFHYLTIPVGVQLMLPIRNGGLYASFDPQLGFLLSAKRKVHNTEPGGMVTDEEINMRDVPGNDFPNLNFSLGFRVGGEKAVGKHALFFESGYDYGLVNISEAVFDGEKVGTRTGVLTILCVGFRYNTLDKYRK
jgi:hypothetical protein